MPILPQTRKQRPGCSSEVPALFVGGNTIIYYLQKCEEYKHNLLSGLLELLYRDFPLKIVSVVVVHLLNSKLTMISLLGLVSVST